MTALAIRVARWWRGRAAVRHRLDLIEAMGDATPAMNPQGKPAGHLRAFGQPSKAVSHAAQLGGEGRRDHG
jgi:hypothetical protein